MVGMTTFVQDCPVCGRPLEIRVEYLGRKVVCRHCRGELTARDQSAGHVPLDSRADLMRRAESLLGRAPAVWRRVACDRPADVVGG